MFVWRNKTISWLEKVHFFYCINTDYKLSYQRNLYCRSTKVFIWKDSCGLQRTKYVYSTCYPPPHLLQSHMLSMAGPLHLSWKTDIAENSQGLPSLPNSSTAQTSLSLLFVSLQGLPLALSPPALLCFDNRSGASKWSARMIRFNFPFFLLLGDESYHSKKHFPPLE